MHVIYEIVSYERIFRTRRAGTPYDQDGVCNIDMTLTAPNCPAADFLVEDVKQKVGSVDGINEVNVNIVFEPEWNKDMMSEEAKLELGFL